MPLLVRSAVPALPYDAEREKDGEPQEEAPPQLLVMHQFNLLLTTIDTVFANAEQMARDGVRQVVPAEYMPTLIPLVAAGVREYMDEFVAQDSEVYYLWKSILEWPRKFNIYDIIYLYDSPTPEDSLPAVELWAASLLAQPESARPTMDIYDTDSSKDALFAAAAAGWLEVVQFFVSLEEVRVYGGDYRRESLLVAAKHGRIAVVQWLLTQPTVNTPANVNDAISEAAGAGHLRLLKWLAALPTADLAFDDQHAFRTAVFRGPLPVVQWLAAQPGVNVTRGNNFAFRMAAEYGRLEIVQWLATQPGVSVAVEGYDALIRAAKNGHLHVVKWLAAQETFNITQHIDAASREAIAYDHLDVLQWLAAQPGFTLTIDDEEIFELAAQHENLRVMEWLLGQPGRNLVQFSNRAFIWAAENGHLHAMQFFAAQMVVSVDSRGKEAIILAARNGHLPVVQYLAAQPGIITSKTFGEGIAFEATSIGWLNVAEWLASMGFVSISALMSRPGNFMFAVINAMPEGMESNEAINIIGAISAIQSPNRPVLDHLMQVVKFLLRLDGPFVRFITNREDRLAEVADFVSPGPQNDTHPDIRRAVAQMLLALTESVLENIATNYSDEGDPGREREMQKLARLNAVSSGNYSP